MFHAFSTIHSSLPSFQNLVPRSGKKLGGKRWWETARGDERPQATRGGELGQFDCKPEQLSTSLQKNTHRYGIENFEVVL